MRIQTLNTVIRPFERKDAEKLFYIVREKDILRFMPDWAGERLTPQDYYAFIDWQQRHKDSTDLYQNKRYAVALPGTDEMIGMVGMGLEETLNEVEVAYFISQRHQRRGYAREAVDALARWCFQVPDIPYLIATIDAANEPSCQLAEKCGFVLFEKRTPVGHKQPNMESDSYFYFRRYR